jgi:hypothetical protein
MPLREGGFLQWNPESARFTRLHFKTSLDNNPQIVHFHDTLVSTKAHKTQETRSNIQRARIPGPETNHLDRFLEFRG